MVLSDAALRECVCLFLPSNRGLMNCTLCFQPGALQQSENGVENSEKFYKLIRPFEGMARIQRPNAVTDSGYKFTCYQNRV